MPNYIFPGLWPFIERVARGRDLHQLGRARELWHCKQIQDSLGQLPRLDPGSQLELLAHVNQIRESLALALEGCDAAILEVTSEFGLPAPPWTSTLTQARKEAIDPWLKIPSSRPPIQPSGTTWAQFKTGGSEFS